MGDLSPLWSGGIAAQRACFNAVGVFPLCLDSLFNTLRPSSLSLRLYPAVHSFGVSLVSDLHCLLEPFNSARRTT